MNDGQRQRQRIDIDILDRMVRSHGLIMVVSMLERTTRQQIGILDDPDYNATVRRDAEILAAAADAISRPLQQETQP